MTLLLALLLAASVLAGEAAGEPWYLGQPVVMVSLEAADGGLPGENLEPLLNARQGSTYRALDVRADLAMLHRVGQFAAVEAHVEPWVGYDEEGRPRAAVRLSYLVVPPPRLRRISVEGAGALSSREVEGVSGLAKGDAWYPGRDAGLVIGRIRSHYQRVGFPDARITVHTRPVGARQVDVSVKVTEGAPELLAGVAMVDLPTEIVPRAERLARREGLKVGRPLRRESLIRGAEAVRRAAIDGGYPAADVRAVSFSGEEGTQVTFVVNPGSLVSISIDDARKLNKREVREAASQALGHHASPDAQAELEAWLANELRRSGFLSARAQVSVEEEEGHRSVDIRVDRGRRYRLHRVTFDGASAFSASYLEDAMKEASPEVLGRGRVTPEAVDAALQVLQEFYRSHGYLEARLERQQLEPGLTRGLRAAPLFLAVKVDEGPRSWLRALEVEGEGGVQDMVEAAAADLVDQPFNPAAIQELARDVTGALREEGYLDASVRVREQRIPGTSDLRATLVVNAGSQVLLRNLIIQGHKHTRRKVMEREVRARVGEPVSPSALEETRRRLYDLDLFSRVEPQLVGDEDRIKDLLLQVEESSRYVVEVGGGVSTDEGVRTFVRASRRNLWGLAHRLSGLAVAGLAYQGEDWRLDLARPEWSAGLRYQAPHVLGPRRDLFIDLLLNEENQHLNWRMSRTAGGLGLETGLGSMGRLALDYRLEWRRLEDVDQGILVEHDPWLPLLGLELEQAGDGYDPDGWGEIRKPSEGRLVSGPGLILVLDNRDDPTSPRRGFRWTTQVRATDSLFSSTPLLVARTHLVELIPMGRVGLLLSGQAGVGRVLAGDSVLPVEERFRLGGATTLRGHQQESVGPKNRLDAYDPGYPAQILPLIEASALGHPYRWVATGGDAMLAASVELKVPVQLLGLGRWPGAALVGFGDLGNAYWLDPRVGTSTTTEGGQPLFRAGVGVGFRYSTPVGPLQLDLGVNPSPIEAHDEIPYRLHLSLGTM